MKALEKKGLVLSLVLTVFASAVVFAEGSQDGKGPSIGENAFADNQITSVTIDMTTIPDNAFNGRFKLYFEKVTSVTIGNNVTSIGNNAFSNNQLTSVTIGNNVTSIGNSAFYNNQLTSVIIGNSVTTIGDRAFFGNNLTSVTIPNSVTTIGDRAFSGNNLTSVTIPNSVTTIGDGAFYDNNLTSVTIPNSVTTIGGVAFSKNRLTSVTIPNSVTTINGSMFSRNPNLTEILCSADNPAYTSVDGVLFSKDRKTLVAYPTKKTPVIIPDGVTAIGDSTFASNARSITIGANVRLGANIIDNNAGSSRSFEVAYGRNNNRAGTYYFDGKEWVTEEQWTIVDEQRRIADEQRRIDMEREQKKKRRRDEVEHLYTLGFNGFYGPDWGDSGISSWGGNTFFTVPVFPYTFVEAGLDVGHLTWSHGEESDYEGVFLYPYARFNVGVLGSWVAGLYLGAGGGYMIGTSKGSFYTPVFDVAVGFYLSVFYTSYSLKTNFEHISHTWYFGFRIPLVAFKY